MTCIAGVEYEGRVWLAGDAEWSTKRVRSNSADPKVWLRDGIVWGMSGEGRPADLIKYGSMPRRPAGRVHIHEWITLELIPAITALLKRDGCDAEWAALVGVRGELWELDSGGLPAMRAAEGYSAVGCAQAAALVGLSLTSKLAPRTRLVRVVSACSRHVPGVGGRITVVCETP